MDENDAMPFSELGVKQWLIKQLFSLGIRSPTPIQKGCIPQILAGDDCIGAAKTGSGKTFAFALPIIQHLAEDPYGMFALVLTPTHELAYQIADQFTILGQPLKLRVCIVTGGSDQLEESLKLAKRPHIVVAMPGRLADHISGCDTFSLKKIKYLVLDEADRLFSESFKEDLETIFSALPQKRQNLLFSATITPEVREILPLNKEHLTIWTDSDTTLTVNTLDQRYVVCPAYARDVYLVQTLRKYRDTKPSSHIIVFTDTKKECQVLSMMMNAIGMDNVCLHGFMRQKERVAALTQFRSNLKCTLVATNVAARGLDIPTVDLVVNHKLPLEPKEYIHRVGRTARAGRSGMAISLITPYDILRLGEIEAEINTKLSEYKIDDDEAVKVFTTVSVTRREQEAQLDNEEFETRKRNYNVKRWIQAGVDPDAMEAGLEEMHRKRIKAAKKAKLAKIKQLQAQMKNKQDDENNTQDNSRLRSGETEDTNIDATIKDGLKKINKNMMKKDERFRNVIGKISKIKRKADNVKQKQERKKLEEKSPKKKKKRDANKTVKDDEAVKVFTTVSVTRREQEAQLDNEEFETRKRNYNVKRWIQAGVDPDAMEAGLEEMHRKRIKAAKKAKLAKIKQLQAQMKNKQDDENNTQDNSRLRSGETEDTNIDATIKDGLKKINKNMMKKDERFRNVIGKISKIKRKADNVKQKQERKKLEEKSPKKKKKRDANKTVKG